MGEGALAVIDPKDCAFFIPPHLKTFKLALFERIANHMRDLGGTVIRYNYQQVEKIAGSKITVIGWSPPFAAAIKRWQLDGRPGIYWLRGYLRIVFATSLPHGGWLGVPGGFYRWQFGGFQLPRSLDLPDDRWRALKLEQCVKPWRMGGDKIVIADTLPDYWNLRGLPEHWSQL